jgi:hypothetical protein
VSRSTGRKGFSLEINRVFAFVHVVDACLTLRHTVWRDGSGSVSSYTISIHSVYLVSDLEGINNGDPTNGIICCR